MKKLLILTEKFPPNTETASNRPSGWAKYFHQFGYKPIIVTRNWDLPFTENLTYQYTPVGDKVRHEVYDTHEVYYLPYTGNVRTRFLLKYKHRKYKMIYRVLSLLEQLAFTTGFYRFTEFAYFFHFTQKFLKEHTDIKLALITGCPFNLFNVGSIINKKFGIKWIADYRDPWTIPLGVLARAESQTNFLHRIIGKLERRAEERWVNSASHITSVSEYLTQTIASKLGKEGTTIYNGYLPEDNFSSAAPKEDSRSGYTIIYNGSLYPIQKIEIFLEGFKKTVDAYKHKINVNFQGIGIDFIPEAAQRVRDNGKGYEQYINITGRLPKKEYLHIQDNAQLLLIAGTGASIKGITSSKIFDYILVKKPVLLVGNDKDVVEKILLETGQGIFADTPEEVFDRLSALIEEYRATGTHEFGYNAAAAGFYSRENQTKMMADTLKHIERKD